MYRLEGSLKDYAWGSRTAIARLCGRSWPTEKPEAELWLGAHPGGSAQVLLPEGALPLDAVIRQDPGRMVGRRLSGRSGGGLPFLLKLLAAASPLSLQAHPNAEQAALGFATENARGIPLAAPHRNYRDPSHKPEVIVALETFRALCGFRDPDASAALLGELAVPALAPTLAALRTGSPPARLRAALETLLGLDASARARLIAATTAACVGRLAAESPHTAEFAMAVELARHYPEDLGVVVALLLNLVTLSPGQAMFLPAGNLHAYLEGFGVELMASSDNVLRCGLTPKHVDVPELLRVLDFSPLVAHPVPVERRGSESLYVTPTAEFRLSRVELTDAAWSTATTGPEILLVTAGTVTARSTGTELPLPTGAAAFVPAVTDRYELTGRGTLYRATVPEA